ncbi:hypothetical protein SDC9_155301 [bioreactor metagenome]|uniref:Uncharacterized protein n=1 Tax=bioreactor metagenome TaxID=1076179 RepID=A0A645F148_9ZZZZ
MGGTSTKGTRTEQVIFPFTVGNVVTRRMSKVVPCSMVVPYACSLKNPVITDVLALLE